MPQLLSSNNTMNCYMFKHLFINQARSLGYFTTKMRPGYPIDRVLFVHKLYLYQYPGVVYWSSYWGLVRPSSSIVLASRWACPMGTPTSWSICHLEGWTRGQIFASFIHLGSTLSGGCTNIGILEFILVWYLIIPLLWLLVLSRYLYTSDQWGTGSLTDNMRFLYFNINTINI